MKRNVLYNLLLLPLAMSIATWSMSQTATTFTSQPALAPDQNPDYMVSQAKYTMMADSINSWHGTSIQETYKAIDWVADRQAARAQRRAFRHELRMARARYGYDYYYNDYGYNYPGYRRNYYGNYYPVYSRNYGYNYDPYYQYRPSRNYWGLLGVAATAATIGYLIAK